MALMRGGRKYRGWGLTAEQLAAVFDALQFQVEALGHWKDNKAPKLPRFPRPGDDERKAAEKAKSKPRTVADLFKQFA